MGMSRKGAYREAVASTPGGEKRAGVEDGGARLCHSDRPSLYFSGSSDTRRSFGLALSCVVCPWPVTGRRLLPERDVTLGKVTFFS